MGTTAEWMQVVEVGALYGFLTLLWEATTKRHPFARVLNFVAIALMSLLFGMMMAFQWRVLHGGMAVVFAMAVTGLFVTALMERRARRRVEVSSKAR